MIARIIDIGTFFFQYGGLKNLFLLYRLVSRGHTDTSCLVYIKQVFISHNIFTLNFIDSYL